MKREYTNRMILDMEALKKIILTVADEEPTSCYDLRNKIFETYKLRAFNALCDMDCALYCLCKEGKMIKTEGKEVDWLYSKI